MPVHTIMGCNQMQLSYELNVGSTDMLSIIGIIVAVNGILSTNADANADTIVILNIVAPNSPPVSSSILCARSSKAPETSTPPTMINNPQKKSRVGHSTWCNALNGCIPVITRSTAAPPNAIIDTSRSSIPCNINMIITAPRTIAAFF